MNLNHIAKKPFWDIFYKGPLMHNVLRSAFHDAATYDHASQTGGVVGSLRLKEVLQREEHEGIKRMVGIIKKI